MGKLVKVIITTPSFSGGVSNYIKKLCSGSNKTYVNFIKIRIGKRHSESSIFFRQFEYTWNLINFAFLLLKKEHDLIHLNPSLNYRSLVLHYLLLTVANIFSSKPKLIFFRGWDEKIANSMINGLFIGKIIKYFLLKANYYLVLSKKISNQLISAGFPAEKISTTSVMVNVDEFDNYRFLRKNLKNEIVILFMSRIEKNKGIWLLIDMLKWWNNYHSSKKIKIIIAGHGSESGSLKSYVKQEHLQESVHIFPFVHGEKKFKLFKEADLFIFPSTHSEGFPNVVLEALAAGLPIIYTPVGALNEILTEANGYRIEINNLSGISLGQTVLDLYNNYEKRKEMSHSNVKMVKEKYDTSIVCSNMLSFYKKLISNSKN